MKYLSSQFGFLFAAGETRANLTALFKYFAFLIVMIIGYAVIFHLIMGRVEGQQHSWITGFTSPFTAASSVPTSASLSRITHERNVEAIHRAGADFVLSYTSLGVDSIMSLVNGDATVMLGEGVRLFEVRVPRSLAGQPLAKTGIGSRTGLSVVAIEEREMLTTQLTAETTLPEGGTLLMLGNADQRQRFAASFELSGR